MSIPNISFSKNHNVEFYKTLQHRVREYFKETKKSRYANANMVLKTCFMLALYFTPFILIITVITNPWISFLMWILMGFGMAGIGLSVMHDANHGAYSKNKRVNSFLGFMLNVLGGSDINWRIQHNILHHTYTNVTGMDEDIDPGKILRFSPHVERYKIHRYQHVYAWFLYGLMTLMWCTVKDYRQAVRYKRKDLIKTQGTTYGKAMAGIIVSKVIYFAFMFTLPLVFSPLSWWMIILGFLAMQFVAGLVLAMIFQPAHVVPSSNYPVPDDSGNIDADWAVSQLFNTANFAPKARIFSWYVGGLNFQIEHHLFPNICHVHYSDLAKIVKETTEEFNLPYISQKTFYCALKEHTIMLRNLGRYDLAPGIH